MWRPQRLFIKNLMSIEEESIDIPIGKVPLIFGQNDYDDGQKSNGAGKSAILEAFAILLTSKPLRQDCSAKDLVRDDQSEMILYLKLHNDYLKQTLEIERTYYGNTKPSELVIHINEKEVRDLPSVNDGNQFIIDQIGISKEDLVNYYLISKEKYTPFLKMSDTAKKTMINRFSNADRVEGVVEDVDLAIKTKEQDLETFEDQLNTKQIKYDQTQEIIESLENDNEDKEDDTEEKIKAKKAQIIEREGEIEQLESSIKQDREKVDELRDTEKEVDQQIESVRKKRSKRNEEIENQEEVLEEIEQEIRDIKAKVKEIDVSLMGIVSCPKCDHEFNPGDDSIDVDEQRERKKKGEKILSEVEDELKEEELYKKELDKVIAEFDQSIRDHKKQRTVIEDKISSLERSIRKSQRRMTDCEDDIESLFKQIESLQDRKDEQEDDKSNVIVQWQEKLKELNKDIEKYSKEIEKLEEEIEKLTTEKSILTQFKTHLANKAIGSIEAHCNEYLSKTGSDISVQLDGYTMTKKKEIREKITATILKRGDANKFGRLSSGEKARVELAFIVAPQTLINSTCESGGLDLLFMDEVIESIDSTGIGGLLHSLSSLDQTIFIVTHATYDKPYPYSLTVHKKADGVAVFNTQW